MGIRRNGHTELKGIGAEFGCQNHAVLQRLARIHTVACPVFCFAKIKVAHIPRAVIGERVVG